MFCQWPCQYFVFCLLERKDARFLALLPFNSYLLAVKELKKLAFQSGEYGSATF